MSLIQPTTLQALHRINAPFLYKRLRKVISNDICLQTGFEDRVFLQMGLLYLNIQIPHCHHF